MAGFPFWRIYLNLAEAAMELNKSSEALDAVNKIRERARNCLIVKHQYGKIRYERKVELHSKAIARDMKRWRILTWM